jgi:hypothetical protein
MFASLSIYVALHEDWREMKISAVALEGEDEEDTM